MPPKKMKVKKRKTKQKPTTSNINKQVVIVNQPAPVKRKYTRRKKTTQQPTRFSTPESAIGQVINLLRFIPQQQQPNYDSLQNQPNPPYIPMLDNRQHNYDDDKMSSVSGSSRDLSDVSSIDRFEQDKRTGHKPALLAPINENEEEGGGGGKIVGMTPGFGGEFNRYEIQYKDAKRKLDTYKGKDPDIIRERESNFNSARKIYNIQRRNSGLKPV